MNKLKYWIGAGLIISTIACSERHTMSNLYDITVERIDGTLIPMSDFKGKTLLIVNTASRCGFTGQYNALEKIYERYKDQEFIVLAFPSNNFMGQEPGSNAEIAQFCENRFQLSFPLFSKINVKGNQQHPLYKWLTSKENHPSYGGKITWNFNKFLISPSGEVIARFGSRQSPIDDQIIAAIESTLPDAVYK